MSTDADLATRIAGMHRRIGRNLLRFQEIEHGLKFMMPYVHPEAHGGGLEAFMRVRTETASGTLGILVGRYKEATKAESPELFDEELQKLVDARNELVHNFLRLPGIDWMSPDSIDVAIQYLDNQFEACQFIYDLVRANTGLLLREILAAPAYETDEYSAIRKKLDASLPADVEIVCLTDPEKTDWGRTQIVKLLKQAEAESKSSDGMTFLSFAGDYIRKNAPDIGHGAYGAKRLVDVLVASKLFAIDVTPAGNNGAYVVKYRSLDVSEGRSLSSPP
jgi:hypothetical protein